MPFKTAPSVPNITSPLPHCMLLLGLSVFDSYFPSPSCGHVSPSSVPPLHVCVVCPELLGGAWGIWRADHIHTCKSSAHLLPIMLWSNSLHCCSFTVFVSVQPHLQNSWKTSSSQDPLIWLPSWRPVYHQPTRSGIHGITCSHYPYFWLWTRNLT